MTVHLAFSQGALASLVAIIALASVPIALGQAPGQKQSPSPAPSQVQTPTQRPDPGRVQPREQGQPQQQGQQRDQGQRPEAQQRTEVQARANVRAEFRTALEPHGRWQTSSRWGEVWVPANRPRDWRPYTVGHWVYTDDWGWYWIEDQSEAVWGLVAFHYGRWVLDEGVWVWIPGEEWSPGWVNWRYGKASGGDRRANKQRRQTRTQTVREDVYIGWAPLPPEEIVVEVWERPEVWIFVRGRDFTAPVIARVILPPDEVEIAIRETVVVNRTVVLEEHRVAVAPGIPPALIAAAVGRPIRSFEVQPRVLAGTVDLPGAVVVLPEDVRNQQRQRLRASVRQTRNEIRPSDRVPELQPLRPGEQGRVFDNPPRAVQRLKGQPTTGQAPAARDQQPQGTQGQVPGQQPQQQQQGRDVTQPKQQQQQGKDSTEPKQKQRQGKDATQPKQQQQQGQDASQPKQKRQQQGKDSTQPKQQPPRTQGQGPGESAKDAGPKAKQKATPKELPKADQKDGRPKQGTEGRGTRQQREQPKAAAPKPALKAEPRSATEGRGGAPPPQQRQQREQPKAAAPKAAPNVPPPATEGRGGGPGRAAPAEPPRAAPKVDAVPKAQPKKEGAPPPQ